MGKRKRGVSSENATATDQTPSNQESPSAIQQLNGNGIKERVGKLRGIEKPEHLTVQIIIGTYEKVLHGLTATIPLEDGILSDLLPVEFADTFLLNAHASAIRCLAVSPRTEGSGKVFMATGGSDQAVNLYSLAPVEHTDAVKTASSHPTMIGQLVTHNTQNREIGSLQHHAGGVNALYFPTKSKLISAADDNTIAVVRTRDWTILSTIKVPAPKLPGRASGDPASFRADPMGLNDFAIHPSMKLMISVGKGEKCMRLWNLVTGKRAAVLNFGRDHLQLAGEGRHSSGEGRKVKWDSVGEEFVVTFDRSCLVYGIDSKPKCCIVPSPRTKVHQIHYLTIPVSGQDVQELLALATEDGRILFYATKVFQSRSPSVIENASIIPLCEPIAHLGSPGEGVTGRIKDFEILKLPKTTDLMVVTGSSDGAIRLWLINADHVSEIIARHRSVSLPRDDFATEARDVADRNSQQTGKLLATYEAGNRITCLKAFLVPDPQI